MIENAPLLVSTNLSNFTVTFFASWTEIADLLDIYNQLDLHPLSPTDLAGAALEESSTWSTQYEQVNGRPPTEEAVLARENDIVESIKVYYSPERIALEQFDVESLVNDINEWSLRGPDRPYLFGNIPDSGIGLNYFKSDSGIQFTTYAPFMIPYIELFYDRKQSLPDWGLQELQSLDIVEAMVQLQHKLNKKVTFSIHEKTKQQVWNRNPHEVY